MKTKNKGENAGRAVKILIVCAVAVFSAASQLQAAENKDFYSDGQILAGEEWEQVGIYDTPPNHTTVDMLGGLVSSLGSFNASTLNIYGGQVNGNWVGDYSTVNVFGGSLRFVGGHGNATINVYDGTIGNGIAFEDYVVVNIKGGTIGSVGASNYSIVNLSGGFLSDSLYLDHMSIANIYGHNLAKTNYGGLYNVGQVSGVWETGTSFTIDLSGSETYSHINLIPEPMTFLLIGFGVFLARKRK
jgi:hypothetical protein